MRQTEQELTALEKKTILQIYPYVREGFISSKSSDDRLDSILDAGAHAEVSLQDALQYASADPNRIDWLFFKYLLQDTTGLPPEIEVASSLSVVVAQAIGIHRLLGCTKVAQLDKIAEKCKE